MRLCADVVNSYDAVGVDQNVPTHLKNIFSDRTTLPGKNLRDVLQDCDRPHQLGQRRSLKTISSIKFSVLVMQHWPPRVPLLGVTFSHRRRVKRYDFDVNTKGLKFSFGLPQLRQVYPTWRSAQVTVKH